LDGAFDDSAILRREEPPDKATLLERFSTWVGNTAGNFEDVLSEWIKGRLEFGLPVNPGPIDPNERPKKKPTKNFRSALESVFNEVRASEAKRPKRKK